LQDSGWEVQEFLLPDIQIADCLGDFKCWTRYPGTCAIEDANRDIARAVVQSDLVIYLTPVTFGGYSSELKKAVDHLIQNISPFFTKVQGETHHEARYKRYPRFLALGLLPQADAEGEGIFKFLIHRNAINMYAPAYVSGFLYAHQGPEEVCQTVRGLLAAVQHGNKENKVSLPRGQEPGGEPIAPQNVLLLVGSPKGQKSSSASLGGYLLERLAEKGLQTETVLLYSALRSEERLAGMLAATDRADLVVLAFPLYVDSLPAPVIRALERIARHRQEADIPRQQRFLAIANSGFPEAAHMDTAMAICRCFARQAGFVWTGGLTLGGGHGLVSAQPLKQLGGRVRHAMQSLAWPPTLWLRASPCPKRR
jgi:multimeric flavodoxin WrbA